MNLPSWEGLIQSDEIKKRLKSKKNSFHECTVLKGKEEYYKSKGWVVERENKTTIRMKKQKTHDEEFEDIVWHTISRMGFDTMNSDRNFRIPLVDSPGVSPAQVDVFAVDENVAIIIECKSSKNPERKSMRTVITSLIGIKENSIKNIKKYFSRDLKIGFVLATNNITISKEDYDYAESNNICLINEYDLEYYNSLSDNLGKSSKYQFLSDVFEDVKIPNLLIDVPAIKGKMGSYIFYSFVIEPSKLLPIAYVSHRTKNTKGGDRAYQRMVKKKRLEAIKKYVEEENGLFPNSIILNIHSGKNQMVFNQVSKGDSHTSATLGYLTLPNRYKSAWVIDGQHRLYGFSETDIANKVTLPVIAFENLEVEQQANMFIDINSKQVKVSKNLLEELHADLHWESPKDNERLSALISKVVIELSREKTSPLYNRIKFADDKGKDRSVTITALTTALKRTKLLGSIEKSGKLIPGPLYSYKEKEMDNSLDRAVFILLEFFTIFAEYSKQNWELGSEEGGYLCTSNGVTSELLVLAEIIKHIHKTQGINPVEFKKEDMAEQISTYIKPVAYFFNNADSETIKDYRRQQGAQGQQDCAYSMMEIIKENDSVFNPVGLEKYLKDRESKWNEKSIKIVQEIQLMISFDVISTLKKEYGQEGWWKQGVPEDIRKTIAAKKEEEENPSNNESYFMLMDYRKIISKNWSMFNTKYGFGKSSKKDDKLSWFNDLNTIRNKVSHPERGLVTEEEYDLLQKMYVDFCQRIKDTNEQ